MNSRLYLLDHRSSGLNLGFEDVYFHNEEPLVERTFIQTYLDRSEFPMRQNTCVHQTNTPCHLPDFSYDLQFLSWRGTFTDVARLGTFPFAPVSPPLGPYHCFTSRLSLLVVGSEVVLIRRKAFPKSLLASYTARSIAYSPFAIHLNPEP